MDDVESSEEEEEEDEKVSDLFAEGLFKPVLGWITPGFVAYEKCLRGSLRKLFTALTSSLDGFSYKLPLRIF